MVSHHVVYQLVLWALIWFFIILLLIRPKTGESAPTTPVEPEPIKPKRPGSTEIRGGYTGATRSASQTRGRVPPKDQKVL